MKKVACEKDSKWWKNATMFYKKPKKRSYQSQHHLHHHSLATQSSAHKCILWTSGISWDQKEKMQPFLPCSMLSWASLLAQTVKDLPVNAGDLGSIPKLGRSPGEGNGDALQYSCLENPWKEEPGRLQSMGSQGVRYNWATKFLCCPENKLSSLDHISGLHFLFKLPC